MEAVMMNSTGNNKHRFVNPTWNYGPNRSLFPYPSDNLLLTSYLSGGHFSGAGGGFMSMPPAVSGFRPPQHYRQQPPLLPLPNLTPINYRNTNITRSYSSPNNNNNNIRINKNVKNRGRDYSLTPKKSKNQKKEVRVPVPPATAEEKQPPPPENTLPESLISDMIGSDPKELDLPKDIVISRVSVDDVDEFSGSAVFSPSPPPSSLPLPTFTLRSKASCKAQASAVASGVDAGATDSLRRLLRI